MKSEIAAYRLPFRSYARSARWYALTYQNEQARNFHTKALATLAMLQLLIDEAAQRR